MKLKMKYTADPWFFTKGVITGKNNSKVAEVFGLDADEKNDNLLMVSCAPDLLKAVLAEEAFCCMPCEEGDQVLMALGYVEGNKYDFVKKLRKKALDKLGLAE